MSNILLTGGTGFVGQHLVPLLIKERHSVFVLTRDKRNLEHHEWRADVRALEHYLSFGDFEFDNYQFDKLVHLAWDRLDNYEDEFHYETALPSSFRFIKHAVESGIRQVLVSGTCFEYGHKYGPINPAATTSPLNSYALAKDCLRGQLELLARQKDFTLQWARLFYMYGAGQSPKSLISQLDRAIQGGASVFRMSGGEQLRDYLPVSKVAEKLCKLLHSEKAGPINICSGKPISVRRLVEERILQHQANIKIDTGYYPYPEHETMAFWGVDTLGD